MVFLIGLVVVATALFVWLRSSDVFAVQTVTANAIERVTAQEISEAVAPARGASLLVLSTGSLEESLEALPYVHSAEVFRVFPNTLELRLVEHRPVARIDTATDGIWLVAEDGTLLEKVRRGGGAGLPLVVAESNVLPVAGAIAPTAIVSALPVALLLEESGPADRLPPADRITVHAGGELVVRLQGGLEIRLGAPTDLEQKLMVSAQLVEQYLRDGRRIDYVDASAADRVAVKAE